MAGHTVQEDWRGAQKAGGSAARVPEASTHCSIFLLGTEFQEVTWKYSSNAHGKKNLCSERKLKLPVDTTYTAA